MDAIPAKARDEWRRLNTLLDCIGPTPCQTGDPEAWWSVRESMDGALSAVQGCCRCRARDACLSYALAAEERFGIWGGTFPEERRVMRWAAG